MTKKSIFRTGIHIILILFAAIQIFPLFWLISFSFKTDNEIFIKSSLALPKQLKFENYVVAWTEGNMARYFMNSVIVTAVSVTCILLFSSMIAYAVTRMRWKYRDFTLGVVMAGMMIPIHATLIPLFLILQKLGLLSTHLSIILPYVAAGLPLAVFIFSNFLRNIPSELEAAAYIDGSGVLRTFFFIIMPTLTPAIATIAIFAFMNTWNEFIMASTFLQSLKLNTLPLGLTAFRGMYLTSWGPLGAAIVIACVPILLFYFIFSEQVEKSFAAGAILK